LCSHSVARTNVPIVSLEVMSEGKQKKGQEFSRYACLLRYRSILKYSVRLKMNEIYFRPRLRPDAVEGTLTETP